MVKRIGTTQRKTRYKFKRHYRQRGKISLSQYFQQLQPGDKVNLKINSAVQHGQFHSRFYGLSGIVLRKKGFCYEVEIYDGHKRKTVAVHPIHLTKDNSTKEV